MHLYAALLIMWYVLAEAFYYGNIYQPVARRHSRFQGNSMLHACDLLARLGLIIAFAMLAMTSPPLHWAPILMILMLYTLGWKEVCRQLAVKRLQKREPHWSRSELLDHVQRRTQLIYAP